MNDTTDLMTALIGVTGFTDFRDGPIGGLRRIEGDNCDILAVICDHPGKGLFSAWLAKTMTEFKRVRFLHIESDVLAAALRHRGFIEVEWFEKDERVTGMKWNRNQWTKRS